MSQSTQETGQQGERIAQHHLEQYGYTIITTNWRCQFGEVDIVAANGETLVFVEVRTRRSTSSEDALASITPKKRDRMVKAAYAYLTAHDLPQDTLWRIDVIAVALRSRQQPVIDHVEDALGW